MDYLSINLNIINEEMYNCVATSVKLLKRYIQVVYAICLPLSSF